MEFIEKDDVLLEDETENAEEQAAEETVEGEDNTTESVETEEENKVTYTEEELNAKVDELLARKIARKEAKIRKEYENKFSKYKKAETVLNAGLGTSSIEEATDQMKDFYVKKGIKIPEYQEPQFNEEDLRVLAQSEAQGIINAGFDEVVDEVDRLADIGLADMTQREKLLFNELANYRQVEEQKLELRGIGVSDDVLDSEDFNSFAAKFNPKTPITDIYNLYTKTGDKPRSQKIGSMKNGNTQEEKSFYTPEEVDMLTEKDFEDPAIFEKVRRSMEKW